MKIMLVLLVLGAMVMVLAVDCKSGESGQLELPSNMRWDLLVSPNTGRCYEVLVMRAGYGGGLTMVEIPCP